MDKGRLRIFGTLALAFGFALFGCREKPAQPAEATGGSKAKPGHGGADTAQVDNTGKNAARGGDATVPSEPNTALPLAAPPRRLWTDALRDADAFNEYSKELGGERFTKFVLDLRSDAIYYFDVDVYRLHKDFIFPELLHLPITPENKRLFDRNYTSVKPEFAMCYLVHHLAADKWSFAFWAGDRATAEHVTRAYKRMKETFYLGDNVAYRPDSAFQEKLAKTLKGIPVIYNNDLYQQAAFVAFSEGRAVGKLRVIPATAKEADVTFGVDEIVLMQRSLSDITPVAGIITEEFSTPLSHVSLRARAWGIPNIGLKQASVQYAHLNGKMVYLEAAAGAFTLREATADEVTRAAANRATAQKVIVPKANLAQTAFRDLSELRASDVAAFGAKAANLGEIVYRKPAGFVVPPAFAIPISRYEAHLQAAGIDAKITRFLEDPATRKDAAKRKAALAKIREAIVAAPLDAAVLDEVEATIGRLATVPAYGEGLAASQLAGSATTASAGSASATAGAPATASNTPAAASPSAVPGSPSGPANPPAPGSPDVAVAPSPAQQPPGFFVRSSTTVEDLPGFNGAGLYDSVPNVRGRANLDAAIKQVWASVWNLRAFDEREFFGIDQRAVYAAVLVQRAALATAAGVMVTAHPTDPLEKTTFTINAKKGFGMSVVDGKKVPEILLYNHHNDALRVVSRSAEDTVLVAAADGGVRAEKNPNPGKPILSAAQARLLGRAGKRLQRTFPAHAALDIEWVFAGDQLNIVQARPYVTR